MRIGIGISENLPVPDLAAVAHEVEQAGFASLWTNEARGRDALLVCQAWGQATERLEVGTGVIPLWTRTAPQLAMGAATLQEATGGRFLLGLGVGHPATMGRWHGASYREPLAAARETCETIEVLLSGGTTDLDGRVVSSRKLALDIDPLPPRARLYLAAMGPRMLALAAEVGDGVLLNWTGPDEVSRAVARIRGEATRAESGRAPSTVEVAGYVRVAVSPDAEAARHALAQQVSAYCALPAYASHFARQGFERGVEAIKRAYQRGGPDAAAESVPEGMLRALGWFGTPDDDPAASLERYKSAGLDHLVARVVPVGDDVRSSIEHVLNRLRGPASALTGR